MRLRTHHIGRLALALAAAAALAISAHAQTYTVLHSFGSGTDGANPVGIDITEGTVIYGATTYGGTSGLGTVFRLTESADVWTETIDHSFAGGADGSTPFAPPRGLCGTTFAGGASGDGTLYEDATDGFKNDIYSFCSLTGCADGNGPLGQTAGCIKTEKGTGGDIFGTTEFGGASAYGTVFEFNTVAGTETVLHSLAGEADGEYPVGAIAGGEPGYYYYTATKGGSTCDCGGVYQLNTSTGVATGLHLFSGVPDGNEQLGPGGVVRAANNLYGVTSRGGTGNAGMVFEVTAAGEYKVLYSFTGGADGAYPDGTLGLDSSGNIYGTASVGGAEPGNSGTLWELSTGGVFTVLHTFCTVSGCPDGATPTGPLLVEEPLGGVVSIYGTTTSGGAYGKGVVFQLVE